jgi:biotin carboxylase
VVKPVSLAASQGVIRADDPGGLAAAWERTAALLRLIHPGVPEESAALEMLVEEFVSGAEVAAEGLMTQGVLRTLAIFEKPDPLDGPFFEETIYLTPPRLMRKVQDRISHEVQRAALAVGLSQGPVHAELRLSMDGPLLLEIAPRSIGGLCSRTLKFGHGESLEMLLLRHALGQDVERIERDPGASGVMMIPIPRAGTLTGVTGEKSARSVPDVEDIRITMNPGSPLIPLPEGGRYLGFIFARAKDTDRVERALRAAHQKLAFQITPPEGGREGVFA